MKKIAHVLSAAVLTAGLIAATPSQAEAQSNLNIGIGLGRSFVGPLADYSVPPISLSYEKNIISSVSVGGLIGYARSYDINYVAIGARAAYHLPVPVPNLDPYVGGMLGYKRAFADGAGGGDIMGAGHVGARYTFGGKVGAFAEVGYGYAILNLGIAFRM